MVPFQDEFLRDAESKTQMENPTKLRTLCKTRWSSRPDALYTFKTELSVVVHKLESLQQDGDDKAGPCLTAILHFEFIIALVTAKHIPSNTVALTKLRQKVDIDLMEAIGECRTVIRKFNDERVDPAVWTALVDSAVSLAAQFSIESSVLRCAGRQQHCANYAIDDPSDYWRVSLYYTFSDHLTQEIRERLLNNENRFCAEYLMPH